MTTDLATSTFDDGAGAKSLVAAISRAPHANSRKPADIRAQ
jgi:hypothetical protein